MDRQGDHERRVLRRWAEHCRAEAASSVQGLPRSFGPVAKVVRAYNPIIPYDYGHIPHTILCVVLFAFGYH